MPDASDLSKKFALLKATKAHHERMITIINTDLGLIGKQLYACFTDEDLDQLRVSGDLFADTQARIVKPDLIYKPTIANVAAFHAYMREKGFGSLIKENIHPKSLEVWVKKQKAANVPMPAEDMLKIFELETAKVTRAPKRADKSGGSTEEPAEIEGEEPDE